MPVRPLMTKEEVFASAKKYNTKSEWYDHDSRAYQTARRNKWIDDACTHMTPAPRGNRSGKRGPQIRQDRSKDYVKNSELLIEMEKSKAQDKLTDRALHLMILIVKHCGLKMRYKNEDDRKDCEQQAVHDVVKYWRGFDSNKGTNPFSYFTTMIMNGYAKAFKELHPKSEGEYVHFKSIDEATENFYF